MTTLYKARPVNEAVPDLYLRATEILPAIGSLAPRQMFMEQAEYIATALYLSLPGGTIDALLVTLLERKRSLLVVRS